MSSSSARPAAAAASAASSAGEEPELLEPSPEVMEALHIHVEELGNTRGGQQVRAAGVSLVELFNAAMELPGGKKLMDKFREHAKIYKKVVKAYMSKSDELNDVSARLEAIYGLVGDLTTDLKPCTCTTTNCGNCACSKKKIPYCTDRCACKAGGKCFRSNYQEGGMVLLAEQRGNDAADATRKKIEKARQRARREADVAVQAALALKEEVKKAKKRADEELAAAVKALELKNKKSKKSKRKARSPSPSSSDSSSDSSSEERGSSVVNSSESESEDEKPKSKSHRK